MMLKQCVGSLTNAEMLALIIRTGDTDTKIKRHRSGP
jgi:DNA repair protein RadC